MEDDSRSLDRDGPTGVDLRDDWDARLDAVLAERIYAFNAVTTGQVDGRALIGSIADRDGAIVAAVSGHTWGGTCQVNYLWVDEPHRGRGLGRRLMRAVETEARRRRCIQIILSTHTFQAPAFYERLGFARRATIPDYPAGHAQHVYVKRIDRASDEADASM